MSEPTILPADVETFARIARKEIELHILRHNADRLAFWHAVRLAYTREPVDPAHSRDVARREA